MTPVRISLLAALFAACTVTHTEVPAGGCAEGGVPESGSMANDGECEIRYEGCCYEQSVDACAAAGCREGDCLILESYPGQVGCERESAEVEPEATPQTHSPISVDGPSDTPATTEPGEQTACQTSADCEDGQMCSGPEGCDSQWTCQPARPCTRDLREYCSCDGRTVRGSGSCPPEPFASRGPCAP